MISYHISDMKQLYQIACGHEYFNSKQLTHSDLKAANVLVHAKNDNHSDQTFLLCDIGNTHNQITTKFNSTINKNRQAVRGTVAFDVPEVFFCLNKPLRATYAFATVMNEIAELGRSAQLGVRFQCWKFRKNFVSHH